MGNHSSSPYGFGGRFGGGPRFGSTEFGLLYGNGNGNRRRRPITLSTKSSSQVENAKNKFIHFVFETDFDFMPEKTKLKKEIFDHMTKDARNAVRQYVKSRNASCVFRAEKQRFRGQKRVFHGFCNITKATKQYILDNESDEDIVRDYIVTMELSLCAFLCFAGIPHHDAKGWILDDIQQNEFEQINDIKQYLSNKALIWKKPIHCTQYTEYTGKQPKDLKNKLKNRDEPNQKIGRKTNINQDNDNNNKHSNNSNNKKGQKRTLDSFWMESNASRPSKRIKLK